MEHLNLYHAFRAEVPEGDYTVELGKANVVREGTDVTIIAYGLMVHTATKAADELEKNGIKAEIIDLRTISQSTSIPCLLRLRKPTVPSWFKKRKVCRRSRRSYCSNQRESDSAPGSSSASRDSAGYRVSIRANRGHGCLLQHVSWMPSIK